MANMCINTIVIDHHYDRALFNSYVAWVETAVEGYPPIIGFDEDDRWLFDIADNGGGEFFCESKWAPPLSTLIKIARAYKFSFSIEYEELGDAIYGEGFYNYENGSYTFRDVDTAKVIQLSDIESENLYDNLDSALEKAIWKPKTIKID